LENELQVDLNLQILFAGSQENISKPISWDTFILLRRMDKIETRTSGRRWRGWKIKKE
jgi:hypothetical protein